MTKTTPVIKNQIRPFTRAALPTVKELRPALKTSRRHAGADARLQGPQLRAQRARLQPARQGERGLPVLALVAQPRRPDRLLDPGRARPDPPRPRRAATAARLSMLQIVAAANPQLGTLVALAERARPSSRSARTSRSPVEAADEQVGTLLRPDRRDGRFALSCFGLLLFLWLAFGGPVPLKPKGYRFTRVVPRGDAAREGGRRADLRRPGRQGQDDRARQHDGPHGRDDRARDALRAAAVGRPRDPAPEDAAGRDLRRADAGHPDAPTVPEGGTLRGGQVAPTVQLDEIFRTFDRSTRAAFQIWMQEQAPRHRRHGRDINDALGNLAPVRRGHRRRSSTSSTASRARSRGLISQHRRGVRRAERARRPAAVADPELQPRVRDDGGARRGAQGRPSSRCRRSSASRR